jgi:hypothetical protein
MSLNGNKTQVNKSYMPLNRKMFTKQVNSRFQCINQE